MTDKRFEDIRAGDRHTTGEVAVTAEEVDAYCRRYDPQAHHLDADVAATSLLGGMATSGWHTASLTMHLLVTSRLMGGAPIIGVGAREMRWPRPTRAGDVLHVECTVLETKASSSGKPLGLVTWRVDTINQHGQTVMEMTTTLVMPTRAASVPADAQPQSMD